MISIKTLRESTGLSQSEYAVAVGIPVRTLQEYEHGRYKPSVTVLRKIAAYHSITIEDLISK